VLANGVPAKPFSVSTMPPPESDPSQVAYMKQLSIMKYGRPRMEVEAEISQRYAKKPAAPAPQGGIM
jgi:hypothetical protein